GVHQSRGRRARELDELRVTPRHREPSPVPHPFQTGEGPRRLSPRDVNLPAGSPVFSPASPWTGTRGERNMSTKATRRGHLSPVVLLLVVALVTGCGRPAAGNGSAGGAASGPDPAGLSSPAPAATGRTAGVAGSGGVEAATPTVVPVSYPAT